MAREYPDVMTTEQVAEYLQVALRTVYVLLEKGDLRGVKVGRVWRIRKAEVDRFLNGEGDESQNKVKGE